MLCKRMQSDTVINLRRQQARSVEDRRINWTTHKNISLWFDNWEEDIVELGFGTRDDNGKVHIPPPAAQKDRKFDKTYPSFDGSNKIMAATQIVLYTIINSPWLELQRQRVR